MHKSRTLLILFFLIPFLLYYAIPKVKADIQVPLMKLPYPRLTLYYLIEGESVLQSINPLLSLSLGQPLTLPIDILRVSFPSYYNGSDTMIKYQLAYAGTSKIINDTLNEFTRLSGNGRSCPFYLKYSGVLNIIGLEFDWIYEYGGVKYIKWNDYWIKTILYHYSYQDGSTTYSFRFYYDYTSYVLVQVEEETVTNLVQTQYLKYTLLIGNVFLTLEGNFAGEWGQLMHYIIAGIISLLVTIIFGMYLVRKKTSK